MPSSIDPTQVYIQTLIGMNATPEDVINYIEEQKLDVQSAAYGDLKNSTNALQALSYYGARNVDVANLQTTATKPIISAANQMVSDTQLAKRQNEINQWAAQNKLDTLFVYQQLFIILCATIILVYLMQRGLLSSTAFYMFVAIFALIFTLTIVNRAQYTDTIRDKKYWNKRSFEKQTPVPLTICSS
jgi:hypothetical protein